MTAVALLFPVLIFIGTATRLAAARREQRFAAMRLVGATPRQVTVVAAVEATVAAVAGTVARLRPVRRPPRPPLSTVPLTGEPFFPADLRPDARSTCSLVALGVPLAACVAAQLALRRVRISPLGVEPAGHPAAAAGLPADPARRSASPSCCTSSTAAPDARTARSGRTCGGIFVIMVGLVIAGRG